MLTLTIYTPPNSFGAVAVHHRQEFDIPVADAIELLRATRDGLPPGYAAGLVDERGYNVKAPVAYEK